jgi:hypothetical protein
MFARNWLLLAQDAFGHVLGRARLAGVAARGEHGIAPGGNPAHGPVRAADPVFHHLELAVRAKAEIQGVADLVAVVRVDGVEEKIGIVQHVLDRDAPDLAEGRAEVDEPVG